MRFVCRCVSCSEGDGWREIVSKLGYHWNLFIRTAPTFAHSNAPDSGSTYAYSPKNLNQAIWLNDGNVNPDNYWAVYVNKTVTMYKDYIKIWEVRLNFKVNVSNLRKADIFFDVLSLTRVIFDRSGTNRISFLIGKQLKPGTLKTRSRTISSTGTIPLKTTTDWCVSLGRYVILSDIAKNRKMVSNSLVGGEESRSRCPCSRWGSWIS